MYDSRGFWWHDNFDINVEHAYKGFEDLIVAEVPLDRLWSFLSTLKANDENGNLAIPDVRPADDAVKALAKEALGGNKGAGWAARLFEECELHELPATVTAFLSSVFALFPPPPPINENGDEVEEPADPDAL